MRKTATLPRALAVLAAFSPLPPAAAWAQGRHDHGPITVERPWARPTAGGQVNGAAYATLRNAGGSPDRLVAARTEVARAVELHTHTITAEGVAQMRPVDAIEVPAAGEARLAPGGLHIMLIDLTAPLAENGTFPLTLVFERAGEIPVEVRVERPGAGTGAAAPHAGGH